VSSTGTLDTKTRDEIRRDVLTFLLVLVVLSTGLFILFFTYGESIPLVLAMMWSPGIAAIVTRVIHRSGVRDLPARPGGCAGIRRGSRVAGALQPSGIQRIHPGGGDRLERPAHASARQAHVVFQDIPHRRLRVGRLALSRDDRRVLWACGQEPVVHDAVLHGNTGRVFVHPDLAASQVRQPLGWRFLALQPQSVHPRRVWSDHRRSRSDPLHRFGVRSRFGHRLLGGRASPAEEAF
jgi:hypothetical protein